MENQEQVILQLKARLFDQSETLQNMQQLLSAIVKASGMDTEKDISQQDIVDRVKFLAECVED